MEGIFNFFIFCLTITYILPFLPHRKEDKYVSFLLTNDGQMHCSKSLILKMLVVLVYNQLKYILLSFKGLSQI